jgi:penicillin amidase
MLSHPLDAIRPLRRLLSVGPFPSGGDGVTINLGFFRRSRPYAHTVGASLRMIADLAGPERALFIIPPGQSGHFLSPYYTDQLALWRDGRYLRLGEPQSGTGEEPPMVLKSPRRHS